MYQKVSEQGFSFIKRNEICRLSSYKNHEGFWAIGYGYMQEVKPKQTITELTALALLQADIMDCESRLNLIITVPLSQPQFDAVASFLFDVGPGSPGIKSGLEYLKSGSPSPLLTVINSGCLQEAADHFVYWDHVGRPSSDHQPGRRQAERDLFLTECLPHQSKTSVKPRIVNAEELPRIDRMLNK